MRIICPHCQTIYELQAVDAETTLICHRCNTEFNIEQPTDTASHSDAANADEHTENLFEAKLEPTAGDDIQARPGAEVITAAPASDEPVSDAKPEVPIIPAREVTGFEDVNSDHAPSVYNSEPPTSDLEPTTADAEIQEPSPENASDEAQTDAIAPPPPRSKARIMPWLFAILLIIAGSGFWVNQDAWLDNPWLRSVLLNIGMDIQVRDKDWHIDPQSVEVTWLKRSRNDTVLVVNGEVHNLLQSDLPPPAIHFTLFARDNPDTRILERDMVITRPPLMQTIKKTPYTPPPKDTTPIRALGMRGFILVLENMPQNAGNFALSPVVR